MARVVIVEAKRTPQGRFMGALAKMSALDLGLAAGNAVLGQVEPEMVDQVIVGNVIGAGLGMNIARQIGVGLGVPIEKPAFTVNMVCASGMQTVILAVQAIKSGECRVVLCGGTESMSNVPYLLDRARAAHKLGDGVLVDTLLRDGLLDSFDGQHMGVTAERVAELYKITRIEQDEFAVRSHRRYAEAQAKGKFSDERITVEKLDQDEHPRPNTTLEILATLKPAFKSDGTVTAGNASGVNDGATMLIVCDESMAQQHDWKPLAAIRGWACVGCDPKLMGLGPVYATRKLCEQQRLKIEDFDTIELNEAFAAQSIACIRELQLNLDCINLEGGAIALGHPVGASGARILAHLAHRICRGETTRGLATLCVGGGMGAAVALETV